MTPRTEPASAAPRRVVLARPAAGATPAAGAHAARLQRRRHALQAGFFLLFVSAPALDLLRFDLYETQLWLLGQRWHLGIDAFLRGEITADQAAVSMLLRGALPLALVIGGVLAVAWRWGRLYCGWLCPHFSMVELLNDLLHRASGRFSLWDAAPTPRADRAPRRRWWPVFVIAALGSGFTWAVTLLSYLLPPAVVWGNLLAGAPTANQARFLGVATLLFSAEALFARHLFCRFGCAVGLFQSLAWMANPHARVMAFDRRRTRDCRSCATPAFTQGAACDEVCPMRLKPRSIKRLMFSCVQCGACASACETSQQARGASPSLGWTVGADALRETLRAARARGQD